MFYSDINKSVTPTIMLPFPVSTLSFIKQLYLIVILVFTSNRKNIY